MNKQYVYILSNTSPKLKGIYKIGETKYNPEVRAHQLSKETGAIGSFEVEWFMEIPNSKLAEKILHDKFNNYRLDPKKEFFDTDINELITQSEEVLIDYFKPVGQANIFKKNLTNCKFGRHTIENEDELRKWWEELPISLKHVLSSDSDYFRNHIDFYVENHSIGYIYDTIRNSGTVEEFFAHAGDFDWTLETVYEQDVDWQYWFPEMLFNASIDDEWWFREIFEPSLLQSISYEDLKSIFLTDKLFVTNSEVRRSVFELLPFLTNLETDKCSIDLFMKLVQFPKMKSLDLGIIEIMLSQPTEREWDGFTDSFYPENDIDKLRDFLKGIKLLKNFDVIHFKIAAAHIDIDDGGVFYYYSGNSRIQIKHAIKEYYPSNEIGSEGIEFLTMKITPSVQNSF